MLGLAVVMWVSGGPHHAANPASPQLPVLGLGVVGWWGDSVPLAPYTQSAEDWGPNSRSDKYGKRRQINRQPNSAPNTGRRQRRGEIQKARTAQNSPSTPNTPRAATPDRKRCSLGMGLPEPCAEFPHCQALRPKHGAEVWSRALHPRPPEHAEYRPPSTKPRNHDAITAPTSPQS